MKAIETLEQWQQLTLKLSVNGWRIWQMQYDADSPDGFHVWFSKLGKRDYEVVTHNAVVQAAIIKYRAK